MRVDINGNNPVTSDEIKHVIDTLNDDYKELGIEVKNVTMYVRFVDKYGKTVEPVENGNEIRRVFNFKHTVSTAKKTAQKCPEEMN